MGSLQQALVCLEKRLVVAHELGGEGGEKAQAYCELGTLHSQLGNYEQALSCLEHQLSIARSAGVSLRSVARQTLRLCFMYHLKRCSEHRSHCQDKSLEAEASNALGGVYQLMADNETALQVGADSQCFLDYHGYHGKLHGILCPNLTIM